MSKFVELTDYDASIHRDILDALVREDETVIEVCEDRAIAEMRCYLGKRYDCNKIFAATGENRNQLVLMMVGLAEKYKSFPKELSGGEQQRVAVARAIVNRPDILLADEPTGNLDPGNSMEIMKLLEEINNRGTTVLVVTHNREIVNSMKKRVITMRKGVVVSDEKEGEYHEV